MASLTFPGVCMQKKMVNMMCLISDGIARGWGGENMHTSQKCFYGFIGQVQRRLTGEQRPRKREEDLQQRALDQTQIRASF